MTVKDDIMTGVVFETSAACQLKCPFCFRRSYDKRPEPLNMPVEVVQAVSAFLPKMENVDLTGWGEPLLNKKLFDIIRLIRKSFAGKLNMTTNGLLLTKQNMREFIELKLGTVCISSDAAFEETYKTARPGGDFLKLVNTFDEFSDIRNKMGTGRPFLFATFLLTKDKINEIPDFVKLVADHGFDGIVLQQLTGVFNEYGLSQITHTGYYKNDCGPDLEDMIEKGKELAPKGFIIVGPEKIGENLVGNCGGFDISRPFITPAGDVSVCCAMAYPCSLLRKDGKLEKTKDVIFGNVLDTPLDEIWKDPFFVKTRRDIREGLVPQACGDCIALYMESGPVWTS